MPQVPPPLQDPRQVGPPHGVSHQQGCLQVPALREDVRLQELAEEALGEGAVRCVEATKDGSTQQYTNRAGQVCPDSATSANLCSHASPHCPGGPVSFLRLRRVRLCDAGIETSAIYGQSQHD